MTSAERDSATKLEAGKPLTLIDASEVQLDGAATLVLTFSVAIDDRKDYAARRHLNDSKTGAVEGGWERSSNSKALRFRHPEPNRELVVSTYSGRFDLNPQRNTREKMLLPLSDIAIAGSHGGRENGLFTSAWHR